MDGIVGAVARRCGPHPSVGDDDVDAITGPGGKRRERQGRFEGGVEDRALPARLAASREESTTMTTRRSRSGRHVLTTRSWARALARQSIERTSSPST